MLQLMIFFPTHVWSSATNICIWTDMHTYSMDLFISLYFSVWQTCGICGIWYLWYRFVHRLSTCDVEPVECQSFVSGTVGVYHIRVVKVKNKIAVVRIMLSRCWPSTTMVLSARFCCLDNKIIPKMFSIMTLFVLVRPFPIWFQRLLCKVDCTTRLHSQTPYCSAKV